MAVTITTTSNQALNTDLLLSGTINITGALADGTETLNVSLYNSTTGANFNGVAQTYDGASTVTYNYANGTTLSVNFSTGVWVYGRISSEVGYVDPSTKKIVNYSYIMTFDWTDISGTQSKTATITTIDNVIVNDFSPNSFDDLDTVITGTCDVSIINISGVTIKVNVSVDTTSLVGTAKTMTSATGSYTWTYADGSSILIDLAAKTFAYTRKTSDVGDSTINDYLFTLTIDTATAYANIASVVGFPPSINDFSATTVEDSETSITGRAEFANASNTPITVSINHDGVIYSGVSQNYVANSTLVWNYSDGSSFSLNTSNNTWSYVRVPSDTTNLISDRYVFTVSLSNRYGSDSANITVTTAIPKATIIGFSADNVADDSSTITGVLKYSLPSLATSPTLKVDVAVNGATYLGSAMPIGSSAITFNYGNGSKLVVDISTQTFVYTRASADTSTSSADTYIFDCTINVNGQATTQTMTVKSLAGVRNYNYVPAYPVTFEAGSTETENTAWPKHIEEIKRIYRLYNENMNYYEQMYQRLLQEFEATKNKLTNLVQGMAANRKGTIIAWTRPLSEVPSGWALCNGSNGTPNLMGRFLEGSYSPNQYIDAGLPNIVGTFYPNDFTDDITGCPTTGALYGFKSGRRDAADGTNGTGYGLGFDASRCSSVYGRSNTVQPPAYTVYWIMKISD